MNDLQIWKITLTVTQTSSDFVPHPTTPERESKKFPWRNLSCSTFLSKVIPSSLFCYFHSLRLCVCVCFAQSYTTHPVKRFLPNESAGKPISLSLPSSSLPFSLSASFSKCSMCHLSSTNSFVAAILMRPLGRAVSLLLNRCFEVEDTSHLRLLKGKGRADGNGWAQSKTSCHCSRCFEEKCLSFFSLGSQLVIIWKARGKVLPKLVIE